MSSVVTSRVAKRARFAAAALGLLAFVAACTPTIGDKCTLSTDCSIRGDRVCDVSQLDGYCTVPNCRGDGCPDKAACVLFRGSLPGCGYDDRTQARSGRSFCIKACESDGDCRDGYVCRDPRSAPWRAIILDDVQEQKTCLVRPASESADSGSTDTNAPVCSAAGPNVGPLDASPGKIDYPDAGRDAEAGADAAAEGGTNDGGLDAGVDAADSGG